MRRQFTKRLAMAVSLCIAAGAGVAQAQQVTIRVLLARRGLLPFRLVEFLNFAADHLLLRRVGGGYVFIHRLFADYLATLSPDEQQRLSTALVRPTSRQNLNR